MRYMIFSIALAAMLPATVAHADTVLSLSMVNGSAKQEMQGNGSPHYSLTGAEHGISIELMHVTPGESDAISYGIRYGHTAYEQITSSAGNRAWQRGLNHIISTRTDSLTMRAQIPLAQDDSAALSLGLGIGIAQTQVSFSGPNGTGFASATLPRAEISLRQSVPLEGSPARLWAEIGYHVSPALEIQLSNSRTIQHEISGMQIGIGVSIPLN